MSWREMVSVLGAFAIAWLALWLTPALLDLCGLGAFVFVGQVCLAILALSALETVSRLLGGKHDPG